MGLTYGSTGIKATDTGLVIKKREPGDRVIALAGNPNVGKSTVFNSLTGLNQHTGNWPGKTVTNAQGYCRYKDSGLVLVDIPGTYSLMAHSAEEEVARDFICFGGCDAVVVVCDATCLERNLNLVLQTMEISDRVVVCVNLMDEARKKNIKVNTAKLSEKLGVPVVGTVARKKKSLEALLDAISRVSKAESTEKPLIVRYEQPIEDAISMLEPLLRRKAGGINPRWLSLRLLDRDDTLLRALASHLGRDLTSDEEVRERLEEARAFLNDCGIGEDALRDKIVSGLVLEAERICSEAVSLDKGYHAKDRKIDRVITGRRTGFPVMILLLALIFWITITGANYPSALISDVLFGVQDRLAGLFTDIGAPEWLRRALVFGVYRVLAWVVSVMLPPMAIFFPLFTLLEDLGYLPRIAFNLDKYFKKCCACGKQALTMCMAYTILYIGALILRLCSRAVDGRLKR